MTGKQVTLVSVTLIIVSALFYLGYKTSFRKDALNTPGAESAFNFASYLDKSKTGLPAEVRTRIHSFEKNKADQASLLSLSRLWDSLGFPFISAEYAHKVAMLAPGELNWQFAGARYYKAASTSSDTMMQKIAAGNAREDFEKVLAFNAGNTEAKNALAILYIQVDNDVMKGVGLLKEIVATDSNNVQALFTLGMLSIQSGQLDKAEQRFGKLISLQPFNPDYYYYLAEIYGRTGRKEKAIKTYETCKSLLKDQKAKEEIESLINQLKKT